MSWSSASSSSAATLSTAPARACIRAPPSSSLSGVSPMPAIATTGGPATNSCAVSLHDHREVRAHHARGAEPRDRAERGGRHRHDRQVLHHEVEAGQRRHVREAHVLERLDAAAAAGAVDEPDEREPEVVRHALGEDGLLPDRGVGRAAADREVVALHDGAAAVDAALADDRVGRQEARSARRRRRRCRGRRARRSRGTCPRRTAARSARGPSAGPTRAGARPAPRRPSAGPAPRAGAAPRARAPRTRAGAA